MPATKRRHHASLIRQLMERPQRFEFFQAVRVIDLLLRRGGTTPGQTLERLLRCQNSVSLRFPLSQIEALSADAEVPLDTDAALQAALDRRQLRHFRITPAFMGLLGVNGVLPYCYTDTIAAQIYYDKNEGGRAFFDSFTHRSMTLFYRAWEKAHIEYRLDGNGGDALLPLQLALAGRCRPRRASPPPPAVGAHEGVLADGVLAHYAALIRQRPVSGAAIAGVLNEYFGLPFRLEQFVGSWETLRPEERSYPGGANCLLGKNMMLAPRYWRRDLCVRLWIGPLSRAQFDHFLPGGGGSKALKAMLTLFAVPTIRFEVHLILRAKDIAPVLLDFRSKLGYGAFLADKPSTLDQDKARYSITF
jgi:type VI secretion system protein ImpH